MSPGLSVSCLRERAPQLWHDGRSRCTPFVIDMTRPHSARVIALLGAESTGKTTLAHQLRDVLAAEGRSVALVDEVLREFCDRSGRTPRRDEQRALAAQQSRQIEQAAARHDWVIADTTALMIAVYSDLVFGDLGLYAKALQEQARYAVNLLTAIDLPWQPDGHQRDGAHVQWPVDQRVRNALTESRLPFSVVCGSGAARLANALACIPGLSTPATVNEGPSPITRWHLACERCGDPDCERHRLPR
jgi:nicotinamide riboside kinase